ARAGPPAVVRLRAKFPDMVGRDFWEPRAAGPPVRTCGGLPHGRPSRPWLPEGGAQPRPSAWSVVWLPPPLWGRVGGALLTPAPPATARAPLPPAAPRAGPPPYPRLTRTASANAVGLSAR